MVISEEQIDQLINKIKDIHAMIIGARNLVYEGKECLCSNRLQGTLVKTNDLLADMLQLKDNKNELVNENCQK